MKCQTTYLNDDIGNIVVFLKFVKDREDDPDTWDIVPRVAWARVTSPTLRREHDVMQSEPLATIEEARAWEAKQLKEIKQKIEAFRISNQKDWIPGKSFREATRNMMDTVVRIIVYTPDQATAETAITAGFARIQQIADAASIFDAKAEAFKLNRDGFIDNPSSDLIRLLRMSIDYWRISDGCFDITIQPLIDIWSAGLWKESPEIQQSRITEVMRFIGSDNITFNDNRINLLKKGMKVTFGAIAKGYAVEAALNTIKKLGVQNAKIAAGGEIGTLGTMPDGQPWVIELVNSQNVDQSVASFQWFSDRSISTSGNYERYFSADKVANHLISPRTGYSPTDCISVTIIAPTNTQTDALATSVFVMGQDAGLNLIKSLKDVDCFIIDAKKRISCSPGIKKYLVDNKQYEYQK
jgi:FAD:protein FMN transferase